MSVSQIVLCTDRLPDCKSLSHWTLWTVHWTKNTPRHRFPVMIVIRLDDLYTVCKKSYIFICPKFAKAAFDFINEIFIWCDIYVATNLWQKHYINTSLLLVYHFFFMFISFISWETEELNIRKVESLKSTEMSRELRQWLQFYGGGVNPQGIRK